MRVACSSEYEVGIDPLLSMQDLFACGVARSGAYNRTLTPFGFQAEERTIWQAPDIYSAMSPFMQVSSSRPDRDSMGTASSGS